MNDLHAVGIVVSGMVTIYVGAMMVLRHARCTIIRGMPRPMGKLHWQKWLTCSGRKRRHICLKIPLCRGCCRWEGGNAVNSSGHVRCWHNCWKVRSVVHLNWYIQCHGLSSRRRDLDDSFNCHEVLEINFYGKCLGSNLSKNKLESIIGTCAVYRVLSKKERSCSALTCTIMCCHIKCSNLALLPEENCVNSAKLVWND